MQGTRGFSEVNDWRHYGCREKVNRWRFQPFIEGIKSFRESMRSPM
jgi:hypothetical protein